MSELTSTPAPARTDVPAAGDPTGPPPGPGLSRRTARRIGVGVTVGAAAFAASFLIGDAQDAGVAGNIVDAGGLLFQLGLFGLLHAMRRTRATGDGRVGRGLLWVVTALLVPATAWSVAAIVVPPQAQGTWFLVLDVFWPLSMLGMFVIGATIAVRGRYRGLLRAWPAVAESWVLVVLPTLAIFGPQVGNVVAAAHSLVGYGVLGLLIATRPDRIGAR